ncbi:MAG: signal transduction histidine kinase, partial [Candidatus Saccharibacteria bacterium]|nr:signal transduction histidine kinase [Candidatus Saccharibacteria bacterium]
MVVNQHVKKILLMLEFIALLCASSSNAWAITIGNPTGTATGGWYKDSFSLSITHGTTGVLGLVLACSGSGTSYSYTYTSTNFGAHTYAIYANSADDPYLKLDSGSFQALDPKCGGSAPSGGASKQFVASIDGQAPFVNITSPNGSVSSSDNNYVIGGSTNDPEGNLKTVQAKVNGTLGPTASVSGTTYSVQVPINKGANSVQMIATDVVGHTSTSNTVTITGTTASSGGGSSNGSSGAGSSSGASGSSGSSGASGSATGENSIDDGTAPLLFDSEKLISVTDPRAATKASDPAQVQKAASLSGATGFGYAALVAINVLLLIACIYVIYRSRPIFAELSSDKPGLRRKIIIIVTLPSLVPLIGMGYLGYLQLSTGAKSQLSDQLQKSAQASAVKLDREFTIRHTIITTTAGDILQLKSQYQAQQDQLTQHQADCLQLVQTAIPAGQFGKVTSSSDCLPFLAAFAQLRTSTKTSDYVNALSDGAAAATKNLSAQENERVNESLASIRNFFPDILEMTVVDNSSTPAIKAILPRVNGSATTIASDHKDLLNQAAKKNLAQFAVIGNSKQLLLTYPILNGVSSLGGVIVDIDTQNLSFVPAIWQSTPKPYSTDQVFFMTAEGQMVTASSAVHPGSDQIKALATSSQSDVYNLKLPDQEYTARTAPVSSVNWVVAVATPASSVLAPIAGIQQTAVLAIIAFVLLSITLGIWFASSIVDKIRYLFKGAIAFSKGDLDYRIALGSNDELRVLGDTMNQMAADMKKAQTALVQKDKEFISMATHELKAPMTAIIGYMSMIIDDGMGSVDDTARRFIREAYAGTIRLRDIVTDMLDVARLESGHAVFKLEPLDMNVVTASVVDIQHIQADMAGIALIHEPGSNLPKVTADSSKVQIILTNFISNAIKYNRPDGSVTISHTLQEGHVVTSIADTGLGIPKDQESHIFEKFY